MDATSGLVLALQFVVVSCRSLEASKFVSTQAEVAKTLLLGGVLGPCPSGVWSIFLRRPVTSLLPRPRSSHRP